MPGSGQQLGPLTLGVPLAGVCVLQALNSYVEQVARGITPRSTSVEFWVKDGEHLTRIDAQLPSTGSLGPLFFAFGLISQEELQAGTGVCGGEGQGGQGVGGQHDRSRGRLLAACNPAAVAGLSSQQCCPGSHRASLTAGAPVAGASAAAGALCLLGVRSPDTMCLSCRLPACLPALRSRRCCRHQLPGVAAGHGV